MDDLSRLAGSDRLVEEVRELFALGGAGSWRDLGGSTSTNLLIEVPGGTPVVARVHRAATAVERVHGEQAARIALAQAGLPTVVPMPDASGRTVSRVAGGWWVEVEEYVASTRTMKTAETLRAGFPLLAQVHQTLRVTPLPPAARQVRYANHLSAGRSTAAARRGAERIRGWGDRELDAYADGAVAHLDAVAAGEQRYRATQVVQVVHGDFWDDNVLFDDDRPVVLLDFGFMAERARVDDLALTLWFYLNEPGRALPTQDDLELVRDLVDRYDSAAVTPLSPAERAALPWAVARQPAWSIGGWVLDLDEEEAARHARAAALELPVARHIVSRISDWRSALG
jgi:Ser/Thr protein kinase RdoA (MazF antagonist)